MGAMLNLVFWGYNASARHHPWFHSDVPCILKTYFVKKKLHASHPHVSNYLTWMVVAIYLSSMLLTMLASAPISPDGSKKQSDSSSQCCRSASQFTVFQGQCQPEQYIYRILCFFAWLSLLCLFCFRSLLILCFFLMLPDATMVTMATVAWQSASAALTHISSFPLNAQNHYIHYYPPLLWCFHR